MTATSRVVVMICPFESLVRSSQTVLDRVALFAVALSICGAEPLGAASNPSQQFVWPAQKPKVCSCRMVARHSFILSDGGDPHGGKHVRELGPCTKKLHPAVLGTLQGRCSSRWPG
jgi:hypothetical protein